MNKLRAGVIGVGYLGNFHAQKYASLPNINFVGVADSDSKRAAQIAASSGVAAFSDYRELVAQVDMVSIVVPTEYHFEIARHCLQAGVHILLEKPITNTIEEADELVALAEADNLVFQAGHLERFNPAVIALDGVLHNPMFIESHRLSPFNVRGTDVNVVMDLMIHDIDIILNIVASEPVHISASGVSVLSNEVDIANARLQFANGCVANVTASRVSRESLRKIRVFQRDTYISIDYNQRAISIYRKDGSDLDDDGIPKIVAQEKKFEQVDTLMCEIRAFVDSVLNGTQVAVSGKEGRRALKTVLMISREINKGVNA
ncbi:MAG: Gfo/Idh/MocA family oxidoreductase [Gammaproteobacteria bacterium]|nr:Gfo/Idh/MocA family oxidoreductase [Gammaproteobacteria bacterium]